LRQKRCGGGCESYLFAKCQKLTIANRLLEIGMRFLHTYWCAKIQQQIGLDLDIFPIYALIGAKIRYLSIKEGCFSIEMRRKQKIGKNTTLCVINKTRRFCNNW
jgi:hypothetical protein